MNGDLHVTAVAFLESIGDGNVVKENSVSFHAGTSTLYFPSLYFVKELRHHRVLVIADKVHQ